MTSNPPRKRMAMRSGMPEGAGVCLVMAKPDAVRGPSSITRREQAVGLLYALAHHLDPTVPIPMAAVDAAGRARRQITERAHTEPDFSGRPVDPQRYAATLVAAAADLPRHTRTVRLLARSLGALGFTCRETRDLVLTGPDVDALYPPSTLDDADLQPRLIDYLVGQPARIWWLGHQYQRPALLQQWKTFVRHLLLPPAPGGQHRLRNLVHVDPRPVHS